LDIDLANVLGITDNTDSCTTLVVVVEPPGITDMEKANDFGHDKNFL
jgi:hypothetical protein